MIQQPNESRPADTATTPPIAALPALTQEQILRSQLDAALETELLTGAAAAPTAGFEAGEE